MKTRVEGERHVAIITGASRGIGRAVAERLAGEHDLVLGYLRDDDGMSATREACGVAGAAVEVHRGDVADVETAKALVNMAQERFGRVDVLVNNAGVTHERLLALTSDVDARRVVQTNIEGTIWLSRAAMRPMLRQRGGVIVNLSSAFAARPGVGCSVYAGSKGFVEAFTRALAAEVAGKGIRVNAVAPGVIETEMSAALRDKLGDALVERIRSGRVGRVEDVAEVIAFLVGDGASYINGTVVRVDGALVAGA